MPRLTFLKRILKKPPKPRAFTLGKRGRPGIPGAREDVVDGRHQERPPHQTEQEAKARRLVWKSLGKVGQAPESAPENWHVPGPTPFGGMSPELREDLSKRIGSSLTDNIRAVNDIFHAPRNSDLVGREFTIRCGKKQVKAALFFLQGLVDGQAVRFSILRPLMNLGNQPNCPGIDAEMAMEFIIPESQTRLGRVYSHVAAALVEGEAVLFIDGDDRALIIDVRMYEHRQIEESPAEAVVRGPHAGFVENYRTNVSLIRSHLSTPQLVTERLYIGARSHMPVALMYLEGVVNPKLVEEVRRRLNAVKADYIGALTSLDSFIRDEPWSPVPTTITTERPDKVASLIAEGHVAIVAACPAALAVPATIWDLMISSEDYYVHFATATALRLIRWLALFSTVYASAAYLALVNYHPEMIPTQLLLAIAGAREAVPFPAVAEVLLMEIAFELIREAGIRIPTVIGPTIGIVGAVILGQAAVQASLVSPILVVVVAISGLGSFAIPNYSLALAARLVKFPMVLVAAVYGIPGLTIVTILLLAMVVSMTSFGVPMLAPLVPNWKHSLDVIFKGPPWAMRNRPGHVRPLDAERMPRGAARARPPAPARPHRPARGHKKRGDDQ
jgi:spore germination protein KA